MLTIRKNRKILLVDDDPNILQVLRRTLEKDGYDVIAFGDPLLAIEHLKREKVDLVITDLQMPGIDGIQLLDRVKNLHPHIPVIVQTAFATIETAVMATKWGAYNYLMKPFSVKKVREAVESAIASAALQGN